ncbi:hypothetical protein KP509_10G002900 [Ceratopteris richardii]|nr:hypothetical protein KP509_10G002900 [Ceratopteris richardii]
MKDDMMLDVKVEKDNQKEGLHIQSAEAPVADSPDGHGGSNNANVNQQSCIAQSVDHTGDSSSVTCPHLPCSDHEAGDANVQNESFSKGKVLDVDDSTPEMNQMNAQQSIGTSPLKTSESHSKDAGAGDSCWKAFPAAVTPAANGVSVSKSSATDKACSRDYRKYGCVMTDEQFEMLRRQISVYSTICNQLVEMHKALMTQQAFIPNMALVPGQQLPLDPVLVARSNGRQRWTPSQSQLQILESVFETSVGTPSKQKIKEITMELGKHGPISETNVYNWFQNRKARAKRKQQHSMKDGEHCEMEMEEGTEMFRKDKRAAFDMLQKINRLGSIGRKSNFNESSSINSMFHGSSTLQTHFNPHVHDAEESLFDDEMLHSSDPVRELSNIIILIDGKPWEVPSTKLDLRGSFGEMSALMDSRRQVIPTDERGFTTRPLCAGENYTLIK